MSLRHRVHGPFIAVAAALVLAGCSGSGSGGGTATATTAAVPPPITQAGGQPDEPVTASPTPRPSPSGVVSAVAQGQLVKDGETTLQVYEGVDLDTGIVTNHGNGLWFYASSDRFELNSQMMAQAAQQPDFASCQTLLAGRHNTMYRLNTDPKVSALRPGSWVCVATDKHNIAAVQVLSWATTPPSASIKFTTWQG